MRLSLALAAVALAAAPAAARPGQVIVVEHHDPTALPSRGPANAPVTIEVFFTPVRRGQTKVIEQLQAKHPSQIRIVYRVVSGNGSARIPYIALEANVEGKFQELLEALDHERTMISDQRLIEIGRQIGLDPERVDAAAHHPPVVFERAIADNDRRRRQRLPTTVMLPATLINGEWQPQLTNLSTFDLERAYHDASKRAADLIDRGADPAHLADAFDAEPSGKALDVPVQPGPIDDALGAVPTSPALATPPLRLRGLPSYGSPDAPVAIVVACNPASSQCRAPLNAAVQAVDALPDLVRAVWAPNFDLAGEQAADLALVGDAALCAERVGAANDLDFDRPMSPGWRWLEALRDPRVRLPSERLVRDLADRLHVPHGAFEACRARMAGATVAWVEAARRSGVHTTPATIVGGRIYGPLNDAGILQQLVASELAPGSCTIDHGCLHLGDYTPSWRRGL